jgi:hypothetical protein
MRKFLSLIRNADIFILSMVPIILGLMIFLFGSRLVTPCNNPCNDFGLSIVGILGLLTFSLTGIVQIYRREAPEFIPNHPFRGWLAVAQGFLWVVLCWIGIIYFLVV